MHLTLHSDYSIRVLMYLAAHPGRHVSTQEISEAYNVSHHHLVKVVHELGKRGYLKIKRGRAGGINLGRPAQEIKVGEVIRAMEPHFNIVECFVDTNNSCPIVPVCGFKVALEEAALAFLNVLDQYSIADMMKRQADKSFISHFLPITEPVTSTRDGAK